VATAALVLASVVLTFVCVDLVLLAVHGPVRQVEEFYEPHPVFGYRMRPGTAFVFASPRHGYRSDVVTNELGLRDDPIVVPKPPGRFRILLLGDSITAGLEVAKHATFEAVCERILARDGDVEVINAGVRGYNLDNIVALAGDLIPRVQPDVVAYVFVDNDLTDADTAEPRRTDASRGFAIRGALGRLASLSHLLYRIEIARQTWSMRHADGPARGDQVSVSSGLYALLTGGPPYEAAYYPLTGRRIERLAGLSRDAGAAFVLVGAPHKEEIDPQSQAWWQRTLAAQQRLPDFDGVRRYLDWVASTAGLDRLDPVPAFREAVREAPERPLWFERDNHLNERGHALLGSLVAQHTRGLTAYASWRRGAELPARKTGGN
jgi:lysophospholipase L1-like esterase